MKSTFILTLGLMVAVSGLARAAQDAEPFVWSRATLKTIAAGDPAKGEELATKLKCSKCHGDKGIAEDAPSPSIASPAATASGFPLNVPAGYTGPTGAIFSMMSRRPP